MESFFDVSAPLPHFPLCEGILLTTRLPSGRSLVPSLPSFGRPIQTAVLVINEPGPAAVSQVSPWLFSGKSTVTSGHDGTSVLSAFWFPPSLKPKKIKALESPETFSECRYKYQTPYSFGEIFEQA